MGVFKISVLLVIIINIVNAKSIAQDHIIVYNPSQFDIVELRKLCSQNKKLLRDYELPILVALAHYPELKETSIRFRFKPMHSAGLTTFTMMSVFSPEKHFVVTMNNDAGKTGITFANASFNAQVGIIGHELAHVLELSNMTNAGIAIWGLRYLRKRDHKKFERATDVSAIEHGLGWQLYEWTNTVINSDSTSENYRKLKLRYYLHPSEIIEQISKTRKAAE